MAKFPKAHFLFLQLCELKEKRMKLGIKTMDINTFLTMKRIKKMLFSSLRTVGR